MRQELFEQRHADQWTALEGLLKQAGGRNRVRPSGDEDPGRLPQLYRQVCNHYALARSRCYSPALVDTLHDLVLRGHQQLYRRQGGWLWRILVFVGGGFPRAVRAHALCFWLSTALFLVPGLLAGGFCYTQPELIYSIMDETRVAEMENMYDPSSRKPGRPSGRDSETDFVMFGFYISNNIGIGFRTFAGGILFGLGTVLNLLFNGVVIGGVAGHLTRLGYGQTFWSFAAGHGALELTAIVISGAAGLLLARSLFAPGALRRLDALKQAATQALPLMLGAALMLVLAAFVEAFWSSSGAAAGMKYAVAALLWLAVIGYLWRAGGR